MILTVKTYPECCVRSRDIARLPQADTTAILKSFLQDLHSKIPTICGVKLKFAEKGLFPTPELAEIDQVRVASLLYTSTCEITYEYLN